MLAFPCRHGVGRDLAGRAPSAQRRKSEPSIGCDQPDDLPSICRLPASRCKPRASPCRRRRSEPGARSLGILRPTASPGATARFAPIAPRKPGFCGFRRMGREPQCVGVRRVGSHPDELENLRKSAAFRPLSATVGANCEPGITGQSLAMFRAAPPVPVLGQEGHAISVT